MSQRRRKPSSRRSPDTKDNVAPIGYVLEWTAPQPHHRHRLDTVDNLRSELLGGPPSGVQQLIVLRGGAVLDADVSEALHNLAGVDGAFIEAFAQQGAPYCRPRGAARWWTARYPEETTTHGGRNVMMRRAALWLSSQVPVLLVDTPLVEEEEAAEEAERKRRRGRKVEAPRLTHQDAATRRSALQHGAAAPRRHGPSQLAGPASTVTLDDELASAIDHAQQQVIALEEMLAELVHDRWTARLGALPLDDTAARLLWSYAVALERNLDDDSVRGGARRSLGHVGPAAAAWSELSQRVQLRIQLAAAAAAAVTATARPPATPATAAADPESDDTRSLDRIAYLGAALLPVSIVSGVLAVEGRYGPGGAQFWVFWAASAVAVAAALGFVCLDRLRLAEVWVEMPTSSGGGGSVAAAAAAAAEEEAVAGGFVADGDRIVRAASAWRRERLGWGRAMKKVSGYYRMRGARWIRFRKPVRAEEEWKDWRDDVVVVEEES